MTTLRTAPESKLGIKLQNYRADRPDEWTMDEFTREAEAMNEQNKALKALISEASEYLDTNSMTNIGSGSVLHTKFKEALEQAN